MVRRAVFLDRDGVLNANLERGGRPVAPALLEEFRLLPGVEEGLRRLKEAGFLLIVITNQPDVATGRTARSEVEAMHGELRRRLPIDDIRVCYHVDADDCSCRKPKPGMIHEAAREYGIDLDHSYVIGDRWRDIEAGKRAGCRTIFVAYVYQENNPSRPDMTVTSLVEAVDLIID